MELPQRVLTTGLLLPEIEFTTSRSSGPGGQNVNKVNSKVTLRFHVPESRILGDDEKQFLLTKLKKMISIEGVLQITSQDSRSQQDNKEIVIRKFDELLKKAYHRPKARKKSKPGKAAVQKRLDSKKKHGEKKQNRKFRY